MLLRSMVFDVVVVLLRCSAASEISNMLRAKKKKKKQAEAELLEKEYVPLDPLDWRAKLIG